MYIIAAQNHTLVSFFTKFCKNSFAMISKHLVARHTISNTTAQIQKHMIRVQSV